MNKNSRKIANVLLPALILFNCFVFALSLSAMNESETVTLRTMRAKEISTVASDLSKRIYDAGVAAGGLSVTKSKLFSDRYVKATRQIPFDVLELKGLVQETDKVQFDALFKVADLLPVTLKAMDQQIAKVESGEAKVTRENAREMIMPMHESAQQIQQSLKVLIDANRDLANSRIGRQLHNFSLIRTLFILGLGGNVILGAAIIYFLRRAISQNLG
jgi:CHASE3 domain sensor protein